MKPIVFLLLLGALAGCVAPEEPPPPRRSATTVNKPAISTADFEDAPRPNRKMGAPGSDSIIRMGR